MAAETWLPVARPVGDCLELLRERPALYAAYQQFRDTLLEESRLTVELVQRCERRVTWLLGAGDEPRAADACERALFGYADAFVRAPHAVTDGHVTALREFLSVSQLVGLTELLALLDGFTRFRLILSHGAA